MKKIIVGITSLLLSFASHSEIYTAAGTKWYGPYTIKSVSRHIQSHHRVSIQFNEAIETTCELNNTTRRVTNVSDNYAVVDAIFSGALAAQAQNKPVRVLLTGGCDAKLGINLWGIEVINE
ncbi:hypothetical protein [Vibrio navarrensis]|uniref:hypothetical protein n=1 Tax=Vibrio navarrensis TaxID=29495 RepID=UPI001559D421|nr:hypothetical protein [Vibrio navarrensis]